MSARRARSSIWSTIVALLAVASICMLSSWHASIFHDDDAAASIMVAGQHVHAEDPKDDPDSLIHVAAHSLGQGIAIPAMAGTPAPVMPGIVIWVASIATFPTSLAPPSLLRPPRG